MKTTNTFSSQILNNDNDNNYINDNINNNTYVNYLLKTIGPIHLVIYL